MNASPTVRGEPPQPAVARQTGIGRILVAVTHDPGLIAALQELNVDGLPVDVVPDLRGLADLLMQPGATLALLDAQALGVPPDTAVDALKNQFPDVLLLVAGHAAEQSLLSGRIAGQKVFRFIHKPASAQRLRLFVEAALHSGGQPAARAASTAAAGSARLPPDSSPSMLPILAGLAAVLALAIGGWALLRDDPAAGAPDAASTRTAAAPPEAQAALERARLAFEAGRFIAADGSSAAEHYRAALRLDAGNAAATEGFARAIDRALAGAEQALLAGQLEAARSAAEPLRQIVPDNPRLAFLHTQIERELARLNADATQRQALQARQAQIRAAVAAVEQRIARGALVEPAADSAVTRFREAQSIGGSDPQVRAARDALVAALLTAADQALSADRPEPARRLVEVVATVNSSAPGLDFVRKRIDEALIQQAAQTVAPALVSTASAAVVSTAVPAAVSTAPASVVVPQAAPPATAPVAVRAPPAGAAPATGATDQSRPAAARDAVVAAHTLRATRRVEPDYPPQALRSLVSGWVEMEFTVGTDGSVRDVTVIESEPGRTFDSAAITAMRRYRYEPVLHDGEPVEQRARIRIRFTAQDNAR